MNTALEFSELLQADVLLLGWRQWADAGSISSGLPHYLVERTKARQIGKLKSDGFYLFQFPGTHDLLRPVVRFVDGFPESIEQQVNKFYYAEVAGTKVLYFIGDEPHLDVERYCNALLDAATQFGVKQIVGFGGVYAEVPYNRARSVACVYSQPHLKAELEKLSVDFSNYHGGASISSVLCKLAQGRNQAYVSFYAFVPNYDLSRFQPLENSIRLENDFMAWLGVMRRVNHFLKTKFDLTDLENKTEQLINVLNDKVDELDTQLPSEGVRDYFEQLSEQFADDSFNPLGNVWEDALNDLLDDFDNNEDN